MVRDCLLVAPNTTLCEPRAIRDRPQAEVQFEAARVRPRLLRGAVHKGCGVSKKGKSTGCRGKLDDGLPTDTAAATCALGLRVVLDGKLRANELGDIVDSASAYECQTDAVDQDGHARMHFELKIVLFDLFSDLYLVLIAVTSSRFYSDSQR